MHSTAPANKDSIVQFKKILEFWHKVEFFIPYDLQKNVIENDDAQWNIRDFTKMFSANSSSEALWQVNVPSEKELNGFHLYLGVFDKLHLAEIVKIAVQETLTDDEEFDQFEKSDLDGATCFASIKLNAQGEPLWDEVSVSTVPWALGTIQHKNGLANLSSEVFQDDLFELKKDLKVFQAKRIERQQKLEAETDLPKQERRNNSLNGTDIFDLLQIFYDWAGIEIKSKDIGPVVIRTSVKSIAKQGAKEPADSSELTSIPLSDLDINSEDDLPESPQDNEIGILNSFYAKDIELAIQALKAGEINTALASYLMPMTNSPRIDLYTDIGRKYIFKRLSPTSINKGHWLSKSDHTMSLMQQFAIGQVFSSLNNEGIFSVNGPPGTGKTTLLSDIFAENITRRARALSNYNNAQDAFEKTKISINFDGFKNSINISKLKPELVGYEMIVASSNNSAVENISKDLPKTRSLGAIEWRDEDGKNLFGYLQPIAHKIAAQDKQGKFKKLSNEEKPWGLISCALGNQDNRKKFQERLFSSPKKVQTSKINNQHESESLEDRYQDIWKWRDNYKGLKFTEARDFFIKADQAVQERIDLIHSAIQLFEELKGHTEESYTEHLNKELLNAEQAFQHKQTIHDSIESNFKSCENQRADFERLKSLLREQRPGFFSRLFRLQSFKDYSNEQISINGKLREQILNISKLRPQIAEIKSDLDIVRTHFRTTQQSLSYRKKQWESKYKKHQKFKAIFPQIEIPSSTDELESEKWQKKGLWADEELNRLRSNLFSTALQLHEAWLGEVLQKNSGFGTNLLAVSELLSFSRLRETEHELAIWQSLFMVVPVISTTFASIANQFRNISSNSMGWLFIDEAGQAVPQAAVGALWRCKRAVVVGDPLQIEPVFTVPIKLIESLFMFSALSEDVNVMPHKTSVQNMADMANSVGTYIGGNSEKPEWIGCPLRVHRRCVAPMFDIANTIAYENKMVFGLAKQTPPLDSINLGSSAWVNVSGKVSDKQVVQLQIDLVFNALVKLYISQRALPPLYIISPFKRIKTELVKTLSDLQRWQKIGHFPELKKSVLDYWCKENIGTVHTFQGREMSIVWMVLGCDDSTPGAVSWASSKPNLLNVAVTRAQHRFFIIGDTKIWAGKPYFSDAYNELMAISENDFLQRMNVSTI